MLKKAFQVITKNKGTIPVFSQPHINDNIIQEVEKCKKFRDYISKIDHAEEGVEVSKIELVSVEMFGKRVGFINMRAITTKYGYPVPSYIFLRGASVGILVLVNGKILLVEQYRVPVQQSLLQAPAGMLDESGDFVGTAATEIQEQTSIKLKKEDLTSLGSFYPSPGGCDEEAHLFFCEISKTEEEMQAIQKKIHGKEGQKQRIRVKFVQYDSKIIMQCKSAFLFSLVYSYENYKKHKHNL